MSIQSSKLTPKQCCESNYIVIKDGEASGQPMHDIFGRCLSKSALIVNYFEEAYQHCFDIFSHLKTERIETCRGFRNWPSHLQ